MTQKHFVQLKLGSKTYQPARVSAESCKSVYDFLSAIKTTTFPRVLKQYDVAELVLFEADGTTKISAMDSINQLDEKKMPLVAVVEPVEIYPIPGCKSKGKRCVTIDDVFEKAYEANPEPKPQFKNRYKRLNDFYTTDEWNILEELNNAVNPKLHSVLPVLFDGHFKEVILPIEVSHLGPGYQRIAEKSNVVSDASYLIVKNEGGVSGGSPDADKKL
ncbi:hypothetical protein BATDEDRAFT_28302 [Batrachochytrium dendrobatidis JAM81]|uniref:Uncharacterized protein n=1 Tax=Batrachochytrium dendrobatidis (strain JAM81 / FGSC 10211) TaxID=684364 RepID=F4PDL9_BATDJ|nr:uncharacterized protein BATDEDRAFT_28302 [Batrachochytrium dendrobatidis JAM81]EGF76805.1 hypothetical protein BATDEDRAFT_28302 [Batrachochytrium dendrobatidis JAM81]|eukprot:XP_006682616.1 hypothetical protein BATDEDRAFT_28302 [Batrachochytrium dendrobatidis JAM81]